tara:strand:- start:15432 stop:15863 length:432 start_codon:yes stop_codon:yes gene_type:complete
MTNEMKLITALCDALGFDVKAVCVNQDAIDRGRVGLWQIENEGATQDGALYAYVPDPIFEYKLTKSVDKVKTPEEPFTKLNESDEIFNTEMFGEVMISRGTIYGTRIDSKRNGQYLTNFVEDNIFITSMIKVIDNMYSARRKV